MRVWFLLISNDVAPEAGYSLPPPSSHWTTCVPIQNAARPCSSLASLCGNVWCLTGLYQYSESRAAGRRAARSSQRYVETLSMATCVRRETIMMCSRRRQRLQSSPGILRHPQQEAAPSTIGLGPSKKRYVWDDKGAKLRLITVLALSRPAGTTRASVRPSIKKAIPKRALMLLARILAAYRRPPTRPRINRVVETIDAAQDGWPAW